ncbi:MAG: RNA chaperone Hfq [Pseudomonadota bacterium]|nr:RNA chaperone Hfq [Pseudomonadota bacterium]
MNKQMINVQDQFLNRIRRERIRVTIDLVSGSRGEGKVTSFDNFCLILNDGYTSHLIYKHAVSMISPLEDGTGGMKNFGVESGFETSS